MTLLCSVSDTTIFCNRNSIVPCSENGRKYTLNNSDSRKYKIGKVQYGGNYYTGHDEAADYILFSCENEQNCPKVAIVVELKGTKIDKSYSQLASTICREKELFQDYVVFARTGVKSVRRAAQDSPKRSKLIRLLVSLNKQYKIPVQELFKEKEFLSENVEDLYSLLTT